MKLKRVFAFILALCLVLGSLPVAARAEDGAETSMNTGDITVEGTNGFGTLLSDEIARYQADMDQSGYASGYTVTGLEIVGNQATVTYDSLEEARLVVALYTEDGVQLLASASVTVSPEETQAVVTFEGEMPAYFMASAYLLDSYDYSPLCDAYDTPMYTRDMQELLVSTVDDYDPDRVLNLDGDKTTNFAVYNEDTIVIDYVPGINTVSTLDNENRTYVITNADDQIKGLQPGDVLAYPYAVNDFLIVKVGSIQVEDSTVTIQGADLEMEEAFSSVKLETTNTTEDLVVDENAVYDGVTFAGCSDGLRPYGTKPGDTELETSKSLAFKIEKKIQTGNVSVSVKGSIELELKVTFTYYISSSRQFVEFKTENTSKVAVSFSGKVKGSIPLPKLMVSPIPGVGIGFTPEFQIEISGEVEVALTMKVTIGLSYENGKGFKNLCTKPIVKPELTVKGTFFIGLDLVPAADILGGNLLELSFSAPVGVEIEAKLIGEAIEKTYSNAESIHACDYCLDIQVNAKLELSVKLECLKIFEYEHKFLTKKIKIMNLYYSYDFEEFGVGACPQKAYRVTVEVKSQSSKVAPNAPVKATLLNEKTEINMGNTDGKGITVKYLRPGNYSFTTTVNGKTYSRQYTVSSACKIVIMMESSNTSPNVVGNIGNTSNSESIVDGQIIDAGICGDKMNWTLFTNGLLEITGTGSMYDYNQDTQPWSSYHDKITKVVLADGITNIGNYAFFGCYELSAVTIPGSVTSIGDFGFCSCKKMGAITIPGSVTDIGESAFRACESLTNVIIPDSVTTIGNYAFYWCNSLTAVTIPDSVTAIGDCAFHCCASLTKIEVDMNNQYFSSDDYGVLFNKAKKLLIQAPGALTGSYTIPDSVLLVGKSAFSYCLGLTSVTIPDSVFVIGSYAFCGCEGLTTVTIPDSVTTIRSYAFNGCTNLTTVSIPVSITNIEGQAFAGCDALNEVYYDGSERNWGQIVISEGNEPLTNATIHFPPKETVATGSCGSNLTWVLDDEGTLTISGEGDMWDYFEGAPSWSMYEYTAVVFESGVTSIGESAFGGCSTLESISISETVSSIPYNACNNCINLTDIYVDPRNPYYSSDGSAVLFNKEGTTLIRALGAVTEYVIPDSVTRIEDYAFYYCHSLESVTIPDGVIEIGDWAFASCSNLTGIHVDSNNPNYSSDSAGVLFDKGATTLIKAPGAIVEYVIPDSVIRIEDWAFLDCCSLESVTIPDSVTNIGENAFRDCTSLESVTIPDSVTAIEAYTFTGCSNLKSVTIPDSVTNIGWYAFSECTSLEGVTIPDSVTSIGSGVFSNCTSLESVTLPSSLTNIEDYTFHHCHSLESVTIPDRVTNIGVSAFAYCQSLTSVTIPDSVTNIGETVFYDCTSLRSVDIPNGVTFIAYCTFYNCASLESVSIPDSVTDIDYAAFIYCGNLRDVYYSGNMDQWNRINIGECNDNLIYATIHYNSTNSTANILKPVHNAWIEKPGSPVDELSPDAVFGGKYGTEATDDYTLKTASFSGLVPGGQYILLALADIEMADPLAPENILYIDQAAAGEDGTLVFCYAQRVIMDVSYVIACGPSDKNIADAVITYQEMIADGTIQVVNPTVTYDGKILTEGRDYVILGTVDFTQAGVYTCYIRGIHNYTGLLKCQYTVDCQCADGDNDHLCDLCGAQLSECADADKDHKCDLCGETLSDCEDKDPADHKCDLCGETLSECEDKDNDHMCDVCGETLSECEDKDNDHKCDACGKVLSECADADKDHKCDVCGAELTECADENKDHKCDLCDKVLSECVDENKDYKCDICGKDLEKPEDPTDPEQPEKPVIEDVTRLAGSHRWETALKVADEMKANLGVEKFGAIIIASGNDFADALAGSYLSTVKNAPILLGWGKGGKYVTLDEANIAYIKNNLAAGGTVYILGGKNAVPELYETSLSGYNVKRLGGANRFETNLLILAEAGVKDGSEILVCTSTNFADSLSASATAKPILLVFNEYGKLYGKQPEFLAGLKNCTFTVIGGESAVSADLAKAIEAYGKVERLAGANRFETSVMVAQKYFEDVDTAVLAYAWNYPDGLCGGSLAYSLKAPLILTMTKYEEQAVAYAKAAGIETGLVLGGETLISDDAVRAIFAMDKADEIIVK